MFGGKKVRLIYEYIRYIYIYIYICVACNIFNFLILESELSKIDEKLIQILAWQRLQQLTSDKPELLPNKKGVLNGLLQHSSEDGMLVIY